MPPSRTSAVSLPRWSIALVKRSVIWPSRLTWTCRQVATTPATSSSPPRPCSNSWRVSLCSCDWACCSSTRRSAFETPARSSADSCGYSSRGNTRMQASNSATSPATLPATSQVTDRRTAPPPPPHLSSHRCRAFLPLPGTGWQPRPSRQWILDKGHAMPARSAGGLPARGRLPPELSPAMPGRPGSSLGEARQARVVLAVVNVLAHPDVVGGGRHDPTEIAEDHGGIELDQQRAQCPQCRTVRGDPPASSARQREFLATTWQYLLRHGLHAVG